MRELFVPSLERRIISFLKEFVYSKDSQLARQFPCFKKFVDIITTLKEPLTRMAEYDIGTVEEIVKNTVKSMIKDDLFIVFLDSIILNNRLSEIYHELESLGIEDDILRNLNIWNLINELDYRRNCHSVMYVRYIFLASLICKDIISIVPVKPSDLIIVPYSIISVKGLKKLSISNT